MNPQIYEYGRSFYLLFSSISFFSVLQYFHCRGFLYPCLGLFRNYFCFALFACFLYYYCDTTKKNLWKKGFILLTVYHERKSAQELRPWRNAAFVLAAAWLLIPSRTTCRGMAPPKLGWTFPHQLLTQKMPKMLHRLMYSQSTGGIFSVEFPSFK